VHLRTAVPRTAMVLSAERKSLNKSVDDLMPNTVEEASRRRSDPQDEMKRILAYSAQVGHTFLVVRCSVLCNSDNTLFYTR